MRILSTRILLALELFILTGLLVHHLFFVEWAVSSLDFTLMLVAIITVLTSVFLLIISLRQPSRSDFLKRTSKLIETRRVLRKQQEALLKIATNKALFRGALNEALHQITECAANTLQVDSVAIWLLDQEELSLSCLNIFYNGSENHHINRRILREEAPEYFTIMQSNRSIAVDQITADSPLIGFLSLLDERLLAVIIAPIRVSGELAGIILFGDESNPHQWSSDDQNFAGSIADLVSMALEANQRKIIENEMIRKSAALESAVIGMAILDSNEKFVFVNQSLATIFEYKLRDELFGLSWHTLYPQSEIERFNKELKPIFKTRGTLRFEALGYTKFGKPLPHEVSLTRLESGEFVCSVVDISERKRAEESSLKSKKFLHTIIDANPNLIFVKDKDGKFLLVNQAVAEIYGTTIENIVGKSDQDFNKFPEEVQNFRNDDLRVINENCDVFIAEEKITDTNGQIHWLQTTKRPLRLGPEEPVQILGVATDISENKKLNDQLIQSQKLEAIGQLAGGIAHDFNNYLTGIIGYTGLLKSFTTSPKDIEHSAEMIENIAIKAAQLTEKLLGFARKGKNQNIPVDLHAIIQETSSLLNRTIEKNITIVTNLAAPSSYCFGDPMQLQQVILNLAINARDAISSSDNQDGVISIASSITTQPSEICAISGEIRTGKYLAISIEDNGCGIEESNITKIFEPFFTTKEPSKGTGMGLSMVYGIVKNHGGNIVVRSEPGKGSSFTILLPSIAPPLSQVVEKIHTGAISGKGHILIVDDHKVIREVTSQMLIALGYDVVTAKDGVEAIKYFAENPTDIDLVILDMVMPNMGGRDCYRELKQLNPNVRAILSTGYGKNHAAQEILNDGILEFVQKPYHLNKLSEVVARVLQAE